MVVRRTARTVRKPLLLRRWLRVGLILLLGFSMGLAVYAFVRPERHAIYQGFWVELENKFHGGLYRVMMFCPIRERRTAQYVQAASKDAARRKLVWRLPVCTLDAVRPLTQQHVGGSWYRGVFVCPSPYYRRSILLSASDLADAIERAKPYARGCRAEYADQVDCPLLDRTCRKAFVDYRSKNHFSGSALR